MGNTLRDKLLLFQIRTRRDPEAFGKIYDAYLPQIYRFVYFKVPSEEEAQDLSAETFVKLWNYLAEGKAVANLQALIYQIARNLVMDYYRSKPDRLMSLSEEVMQLPADEYKGLMAIERGLDVGAVLKALRLLKDEYREAIILRYIDELSTGEIARVLGKNEGNARVLVHRALAALKSVLEPKGVTKSL